jgi:superfamily II DNA or RNA helicase
MRLGKSLIGLEWVAHLKRAHIARGKGLVIAHAPVGIDVWEGQAARHSTLTVTGVRSGPKARDDFCDALADDNDLLITCWSTLQSLFTEKRLNRKGKPKLYPDHKALRIAADVFTHCIIDETHFCMDHTSLRFAIGSALLVNCKQRLGLTGTPVGRNPLVLWPQAFLIDEGETLGKNYYFFEGVFTKRRKMKPGMPAFLNQPFFDKDKLPILTSKLASISLSYVKGEIKTAQVLDGVVEMKMFPEQKKTYNDALDNLLKLNDGDARAMEGQFVRLRQIASGYLPFNDDEGQQRIIHFPSVKLAWLAELMEEMDSSVQGIIFHEFIHSGELICATLTKAKISHVWIHGSVSQAERRIAIEKFQTGKSQILVANAVTGGTSIDLPQADYMCFFESPTSPIAREQAQARPMARALDRPLMLDDLVCAPIEARILGFIKEGRDMMRALIGQGKGRLSDMLRAK